MSFSPKPSLLALCITSALVVAGCGSDDDNNTANTTPRKTNVILMIADGASDGAWDIGSYWENGTSANASEPYSSLPVKLAMTTFPLSTDSNPSELCNGEVAQVSYDSAKVWDETIVNEEDGNYLRPFAGYSYINKNATDSAAAGTALATGRKTYNNAISVDYCGQNLEIITEIAKNAGLSTGIVTSVEIDHATPAVFGAHNTSRNNYGDITHSMLTQGYADLIMGAGHPIYDGDGVARASADEYVYKYISEEDWTALKAGTLTPQGSTQAWTLFDAKSDFEALANNTASNDVMSGPLLGVAQVTWTLQQGRSCGEGQDSETAFACDYVANVPSLETMTKGALNYLNQNDNGFFLMVEGGAVDWAAHANQTARIIEEQVDFNHSVSAVINWVEENSNWDETLLIVTTDHGNSYVLGSDSDQSFYAPVQNPGAGEMPEVKYYSGNHTLELVRVYARGNGAANLSNYVYGTDAQYSNHYNNTGATGEYIDNTNIFDAMKSTIMAQ